MKNKLLYILIIVLLWAPLTIALNWSDIAKDTPGIDLPFGWAKPQIVDLRAGAQCIQGTGPFTQGFPFYSTKHDGIHSCEPAYENWIGSTANIFIALGLAGLATYTLHRIAWHFRR